jgi:hypothetical protein
MSPAKDTRNRSRIEWLAVEHYVTTTPGITLQDASDKYGISVESVRMHAREKTPDWLSRQEGYYRSILARSEAHVAEVFAADRGDGAHALSEIQIRLQKVALRLVERLYPPEDAPAEVQLEADKLVKGLAGRDILRAVTDISRTLTETGRHLRLLAGKSTDIYERVGMPSIDVYIPATLEDAKRAELMGRAAQQALRAAVTGESIDVQGFAVSPASAYPMVEMMPEQQVSPTRLEVGL